MRINLLTLLFILFGVVSAFAQDLTKSVHEFQSLESLKSASWSIKAINLTKNNELISVNSNTSLIPASTLKTITTGIALFELGSQYDFKTFIGYSGDIEDSVLKGDLIIIGGGDPTLGSPDFYEDNVIQKWIESLKKIGVSRIEGSIILNDQYYSGLLTPSTWVYQDLGNYYGASPNSLTFLNNTFRITFGQNPEVGGKTEILATDSKELGIKLVNKVISGPENSDDQAYVYGCPNCNEYIVRGTIPPGVGTFTIKASNPNPGSFFLNLLERQMIEYGLELKGEKIIKEVPDINYVLLDSQISVPLIQILRETNINSNNLYAEHLLLEMTKNKGLKNTEEIIQNFYQDKLDPAGLFIADGSGLSRYNAITTSNHLELFKFIYNSDQFELYLSTFPEGGKEGTIKNMFRTKNESRFFVKSGTLSRVKAFSGFIRNGNEDIIAFSFIVNNFEGKSSAISSEMEKVILSIAD